MSEKKVFLMSGLPRSGSTLLQNILGQNPDFYVTPTSGLHDVMFEVRNFWPKAIEHRASEELGNDKNLKRVLNSILQSYHDTDKKFICDKGRGWLSLLEMAEAALGKKPKVIVPVRDLNQILSSFEKLHRKHAGTRMDTGNYFRAQTVEGRCMNLLADDSVVGLAYNRLRDAFARGWKDSLLLVDFEDLTNNPQKTMEKIYSFLQIPEFQHDFENVEQVTHEDDSTHGMDLHTIRQEVKPIKDDSIEILGKEVCEKFKNANFWKI
jgi:sulfotransferase